MENDYEWTYEYPRQLNNQSDEEYEQVKADYRAWKTEQIRDAFKGAPEMTAFVGMSDEERNAIQDRDIERLGYREWVERFDELYGGVCYPNPEPFPLPKFK